MNIDRERDQAIMDGNADRQADAPDPILAWLEREAAQNGQATLEGWA